MKILVLGGDGYCGWPISLHLSNAGHDVVILDSFVRGSSSPESRPEFVEPRSELVEELTELPFLAFPSVVF